MGLFIFMVDFSKTLIRCSSIGSIMTNPRGIFSETMAAQIHELQQKAQIKALTAIQTGKLAELIKKRDAPSQLSDSCKKYLVKAYAIEKYNRVPDVTTKQMVKGTTAEEAAIQLFSFVEDRSHQKNKKQLKNDFICGTPDLYDGPEIDQSEEIIDVKCSWDIFTFLNNIANPVNRMYYFQLQGYMALSGAKKGTLAYCLVSTPDEMINDEKRKQFYRMQCVTEEDPRYLAACARIERNMIFDDIPPAERVLKFSVERDDKLIEQVYERVEQARVFLLEFEKDHLFFTKGYRKEVTKDVSLSQNDSE
jgi:hypothetical protein